MIPQTQMLSHNPPISYGDCHRAAMASILELPLLMVPHFMDGLGPEDGIEFRRREKEFLMSRGLVPITVPFQGDLEGVLETLGAQCPHVYYLLGGESTRGCGHTVVGCGNKIVHDPHPSWRGITGPMPDGLFWVTFIGSAIAHKSATIFPSRNGEQRD